MNFTKVTMVRIYLIESEKITKTVVHYLKNETKVRGVSVFRAISGFGDSDTMHTSFWMDLSLDLPITIEFFDHEDVITPVLEHLAKYIKPEHIVFWEANVNEKES